MSGSSHQFYLNVQSTVAKRRTKVCLSFLDPELNTPIEEDRHVFAKTHHRLAFRQIQQVIARFADEWKANLPGRDLSMRNLWEVGASDVPAEICFLYVFYVYFLTSILSKESFHCDRADSHCIHPRAEQVSTRIKSRTCCTFQLFSFASQPSNFNFKLFSEHSPQCFSEQLEQHSRTPARRPLRTGFMH